MSWNYTNRGPFPRRSWPEVTASPTSSATGRTGVVTGRTRRPATGPPSATAVRGRGAPAVSLVRGFLLASPVRLFRINVHLNPRKAMSFRRSLPPPFSPPDPTVCIERNFCAKRNGTCIPKTQNCSGEVLLEGCQSDTCHCCVESKGIRFPRWPSCRAGIRSRGLWRCLSRKSFTLPLFVF